MILIMKWILHGGTLPEHLSCRERDLERLFEKFGRLIRVQIKRTYAFIQYEEVDQAEAAMKETHLSRFMGALHNPTPPL